MIVGFTGTRKGVTPLQASSIELLLIQLRATEGHHGDCIGADEVFHRMCRSHGLRIVIHPPVSPKMRAHCDLAEILPTADYLTRNRQIVDACEVLIACPAGEVEEQRSGTWSTVRYARRQGKPVWLLLPNGRMIEEAKRA